MKPLRVDPSALTPGVVVELDDSRARPRPSGRGVVTAPGVTRLARFARWNRDGMPVFHLERRDQATGRGLGVWAATPYVLDDMTRAIRIVPPTEKP